MERKVGGENEFHTIPNSFIPGNGTTNIPHHYQFDDSPGSGSTVSYRLKQIDLDGSIHHSDPINVAVLLSVDGAAPHEFTLSQNYPNPFNPQSEIKFSVKSPGRATLKVYNLLGEEVASLFDGYAEPGVFLRATINGSAMSSGVYFYRLSSGGNEMLRKMVVVK